MPSPEVLHRLYLETIPNCPEKPKSTALTDVERARNRQRLAEAVYTSSRRRQAALQGASPALRGGVSPGKHHQLPRGSRPAAPPPRQAA